MSEHNLPWRAFTAGGVGETIEDSEGRSVCFGFGSRPELAEFIVTACNTHGELLAAAKAARLALFNGCRFPDPENGFHHCHECEGCQRIEEADRQLTAAIRAAEGGSDG